MKIRKDSVALTALKSWDARVVLLVLLVVGVK